MTPEEEAANARFWEKNADYHYFADEIYTPSAQELPSLEQGFWDALSKYQNFTGIYSNISSQCSKQGIGIDNCSHCQYPIVESELRNASSLWAHATSNSIQHAIYVAKLRFEAMQDENIPWQPGSKETHRGQIRQWAELALNLQNHVKLQMQRYSFLEPFKHIVDITIPAHFW